MTPITVTTAVSAAMTIEGKLDFSWDRSAMTRRLDACSQVYVARPRGASFFVITSTMPTRPSNECVCLRTSRRVVDVTSIFDRVLSENFSDESSSATEPLFSQDLLENLQQTGWSLVSIDTSRLVQNDQFDSLLRDHLQWKKMILELFQDEQQQQSTCNNKLTFRSFESGAPGSDSIEPKWSLEMTLTHALASDATETSYGLVQERMSAWTQLLHAVAMSVRRALDLPQDILLQDDLQSTHGSELLRAFCYHPVPTDNNDDKPRHHSFGSSPHTDWGSFTIVYQDAVGGLQTFCRQCSSWIDILPNNDSGALQFVVHVGDMTSLAIQHTMSNAATESNIVDDATSVMTNDTQFPSPLHRVLSPTVEPRVSLVYFAYPPATKSMHDLCESLKPWVSSLPISQGNTSIPYQDYYLLQNQSSDAALGPSDTDRAKAQWERIRDKPVHVILQDKWNQVQR